MPSTVKKLIRNISKIEKVKEKSLFIDEEFMIQVSEITKLSQIKFKKPKESTSVSISEQFLLFLKCFLKVIGISKRNFTLKFLDKDSVKITPLTHETQFKAGINGKRSPWFPIEFIFEANNHGIEVSLVGGWNHQIDEKTLRILGEIKHGFETKLFSEFLGE